LGESAHVFFARSQNSEKIFYSLFHKDLSAFRPPPKTRFFVNIAQVGALYRGTREALEPLRERVDSGAGERKKEKDEG
jgi:hypothetical protein